MKEYVVKTNNLTKTYGNIYALNQVTINVEKGAIYGLVGDNGAGKSTLLKLLVGHSIKTSGELYLFHSHNEKELERERKRLGALVEHTGFYPELTVMQMLEYYRIQRGIPGKSKVNEIINTVKLDEKRNSKCKTLSLGQKQRLGLAIALIGEPELLILDEPINGLDPSGILEIRNLLLKLNHEKNMTILLSSHILSELEHLATSYGFLSKGRLVEEISATSLQEKCSDSIEYKVSDPATFIALLDKYYKADVCKLLANNSIRIYNPKQLTEAYSKLAGDNNIYILGLTTIKSSLEDYYMNLKNGGNK